MGRRSEKSGAILNSLTTPRSSVGFSVTVTIELRIDWKNELSAFPINETSKQSSTETGENDPILHI